MLSHEILGQCKPEKKMTKVLIVDQFFGATPYEVQRRGLDFETFAADCLRAAEQNLCRAEIREVADLSKLRTWDLPYLTTAYVASDHDGTARMLMGNWAN